MASAAVAKPDRKEISPGIFLYTARTSNPTAFTYQIEVAKLTKLVFTIDFEGSENFQLEGGGLKQDTVIEPFQKKSVAVATLVNPRGAWSLKCKYSWRHEAPDESVVAAIVERDAETINRMVDAANDLDFGADSATIGDLRKKCQELNVNFVDVEFPPCDRSLYPPAHADKTLVTWRRPVDFMDGEFDIFQGAVEPADIRQGKLGDCWLMCALSALAERPDEVVRMFVMDDGTNTVQHANSAGVYKVRLCKNGEWQFVRLDDYFPCFPEGGPVYSKGHGNELWVLLVEKAMAKVNGSYHALKGGWAYQALMDLTGSPSYSFRLQDDKVKADVQSGRFWEELHEWDQLGYFMSASTPGEDTWTEGGGKPTGGPGLVSGHAYSIIAVKKAHGHRLLQMRNPWGEFEWDGAWSDHSSEWTPAIRAELGVAEPKAGEHNDGLFWMSFDDFLVHFRSVNVCKHRKAGMRWNEARLKGSFSYSKGHVSTSMYILAVPSKAEVEFGLHQVDQRVESAKPYIDMGLTIMKDNGDGSYELITASGVQVDRQVQLSATLDAGQYFIIPITTGVKFMQVSDKSPATPVEIYDDKENEFTAECEHALREVFRRLDEDMDGLLNRDELNSFTRMAEGCDMMEEVYKWLIESFDSRDGGLTADGFVECYYYMFEAADKDPETVWRDLRYNGYDNGLNLAGARTFVVSVHSTCKAGLWKVPFDPEMYEEATELPVKELGDAVDLEHGDLKLYKFSKGYWGVTVAVENCTDKDCVFTLDCEASTNVVSHTGSLVAEQRIPARETKIMHNLLPKEEAAWGWAYSASWRFE